MNHKPRLADGPAGAACWTDSNDLVALWDSGPYDYGATESHTLAYLPDGTGWGTWANAAGGFELVTLVWSAPGPGLVTITELQAGSGTWDRARPGVLLDPEPPEDLSNETRYRYRVAEEFPPLGAGPTITLRLGGEGMFVGPYAQTRREVTVADRPAVTDGSGPAGSP